MGCEAAKPGRPGYYRMRVRDLGRPLIRLALDAYYRDDIKASAQRTQADPFVIAVAQVRKITVVTEERGGQANKPKIPFVCSQLGVRCIDVVQFIREQGWTFT